VVRLWAKQTQGSSTSLGMTELEPSSSLWRNSREPALSEIEARLSPHSLLGYLRTGGVRFEGGWRHRIVKREC